MEDPWMHENHVAGSACEFDGLHRDSEHVDWISHVTLLVINARVVGPQVPKIRHRSLDCFSYIPRPTLANELRLSSEVADEPVRTGQRDCRPALSIKGFQHGENLYAGDRVSP